jgi:hypothetical protein
MEKVKPDLVDELLKGYEKLEDVIGGNVERGECLQTIHLLPDGGWLALFPEGRSRANEAGKRRFLFADGGALDPAGAFPELELP